MENLPNGNYPLPTPKEGELGLKDLPFYLQITDSERVNGFKTESDEILKRFETELFEVAKKYNAFVRTEFLGHFPENGFHHKIIPSFKTFDRERDF